MAPERLHKQRIKDHHAFPILLGGAFLASCLAMVLLAWMSLAHSRDQYQRQAEETAQNLCRVLADDIVTSYEKVDFAVLAMKAEIEEQLASGRVDGPRMEAFIHHQGARVPGFSALRVVDARGIVTYGNEDTPGARIDLSDRDYFKRLQRDPDAGLVFSKPLMGRVRQVWVVMMARRVNLPDGAFGGMVYGTIELDKLRTHFAPLSIGQDGVIALRDEGLTVILHRGGARDLTGQSAVSAEFQALVRAGAVSGVYTATPAADRVPRILAFIRLQPYGHFLHVGLSQREVLQPWRRERRQTIGFVLLFGLFIGGSTWMAYRAWLRRRAAEREREQVIAELRKALAEVNALSGLLPICASCKKIRDDLGYWNQIEAYITTHSEAQFTHGICPDCAQTFFPAYAARDGGESD